MRRKAGDCEQGIASFDKGRHVSQNSYSLPILVEKDIQNENGIFTIELLQQTVGFDTTSS